MNVKNLRRPPPSKQMKHSVRYHLHTSCSLTRSTTSLWYDITLARLAQSERWYDIFWNIFPFSLPMAAVAVVKLFTCPHPTLSNFQPSPIRNRPNQDWLITSHVSWITSSDWLSTCIGRLLPFPNPHWLANRELLQPTQLIHNTLVFRVKVS